MSPSADILFSILRTALMGQSSSNDMFAVLSPEQWEELYRLSAKQGVLAIVYDVISQLPEHLQPPRNVKIQWALGSESIRTRYRKHEAVAAKIAKLFADRGIKTMILKGIGIAQYYPEPELRECGDIDIWLYGKQKEADEIIRRHGIDVCDDVHHHSKFVIDGVLIENHFDFVNIHSHSSSRVIEKLLKRYAEMSSRPLRLTLCEQEIALPSPDFNALFLLRHAASHFAAIGIGIRHIADWAMFLKYEGSNVNWRQLYDVAEQLNMHKFLNCMNAIAIDYFYIDSCLLPDFERNKNLEIRVLNDILEPEFFECAPENCAIDIVRFKMRRWWRNRWKHKIVYREGLLRTFVQSSYSHLLKPKTIVH